MPYPSGAAQLAEASAQKSASRRSPGRNARPVGAALHDSYSPTHVRECASSGAIRSGRVSQCATIDGAAMNSLVLVGEAGTVTFSAQNNTTALGAVAVAATPEKHSAATAIQHTTWPLSITQ